MKKTFCIKLNLKITFEKFRSNAEKFAKKNLLLIAFIIAVSLLKKNSFYEYYWLLYRILFVSKIYDKLTKFFIIFSKLHALFAIF